MTKATIDNVQAGSSEKSPGYPLQNDSFEQATEEATSTLCLRMLSAQPVRLTPKGIARLSQDQVIKILAMYGVKMGACLLVAETSPNRVDQGRLQVHYVTLAHPQNGQSKAWRLARWGGGQQCALVTFGCMLHYVSNIF